MNIPINTVPKNIQWLHIIFKDFVDRHLELEDYGFGPKFNINSSELDYPNLWLNPIRTNVIANDNTIKSGFSAQEIEVEIIVSDILRSDKENMVETISDVNEIALSAITELSQHPYYVKNKIKLVSDIDIENEWEENDDIVNRCIATLTFRMPFNSEWCSLPINYTGITPAPFTCEPVTIFNSNLSFTYSVPSGGNYELPDMIIESTGTAFSDTAPSVSTYTINDIIWTDSNGLTYSAEYGSSIVATPCDNASVLLSVDDDDVVVGSTMSITATTSNFTATSYLFFVFDGNELTFLAEQVSNVYNWTTNVIGALELYVIATDGVSEVADVIDITVNSNPAFISEWVTFYTKGASIEYISNDDEIQLPLISSGNYNFVVDWGDGNTDTITVWNQAETRHTYAVKGKYTVTITGTIEGWQFGNSSTYDGVKNDSGKIITILNWGTLTITTRTAFHTCVRLQSSAVDAPIIATNDLGGTFMRCYVFNGYVGNWDVSGVQNFTYMFRECFAFNNAGINDMDNWDISSISPTGLLGIFSMGSAVNAIYTAFNQDLPSWDVSNVTNFGDVFMNCGAFNGDITTWDVSNGTNFANMFRNNTSFNQDISGWNVSNGTSFFWMMPRCTSFTYDLSSWVLSSATDTRVMFARTLINFDMSGWDMGNVTFLGGGGNGGMLDTCLYFDQDLSAWKIENVTLADFFLRNTTLSTPNYDATLIGWEARLQLLYPAGVGYPNSPSFNMGLSKYTLASAAATARASLISTFGWTIADGGGI